MDKLNYLKGLASFAKRRGKTVVRAAGITLTDKASEIALSKGLIDRPVTLDDMLAELKELYADGRIDLAELKRRKDGLMERFRESRKSGPKADGD